MFLRFILTIGFFLLGAYCSYEAVVNLSWLWAGGALVSFVLAYMCSVTRSSSFGSIDGVAYATDFICCLPGRIISAPFRKMSDSVDGFDFGDFSD